MLRNSTKTVKMTVKTVMNIIILRRGKWGSAKRPILAVPAVSTVDKQAIEVTCKKDNGTTKAVLVGMHFITL